MKEFLERHKTTILAAIVLLGLMLRLGGLSRTGFNEDEINKYNAAQGYLHHDFSQNREHPMLMKALIAGSLAGSAWWNRHAGRLGRIADETAVRMPNAIFGGLTAVVLFLMAQELFGAAAGLFSAWFWATNPLAISINRVAKEDTLLVLFTWLGYYFYTRAKNIAAGEAAAAGRYYLASGISFGLMLASKYFPHYFGLIFLYYYWFGDKAKYPPRGRKDNLLLFGGMMAALVAANPIILLPGTWIYMLHYVQGADLSRHAYLAFGRYRSEALGLGGGMPAWFYLRYLAIKTPLPVLAAFGAGLVEALRRRREAGASLLLFLLLAWIVPFSLLSSKWLRYMLAWLPAVVMLAAVGAVKLLERLAAAARRWQPRPAAWLAAGSAALVLAAPGWAALRAAPYYALYQNALARGPAGGSFPHEELNDAGLRTAVRRICRAAPRGAVVAVESPTIRRVAAYYLIRYQRRDLRAVTLRASGTPIHADPYYLIALGRKFEASAGLVHQLEAHSRPVWIVDVDGIAADAVYQTAATRAERRP